MPTTLADALARMTDAEETLRAIGAGEIDAFVVWENGQDPRVCTLSTADRPYQMLVENMRDGAATLSSTGLIFYANQRLAELLCCSRDAIVGSPLARFLPGGQPIDLEEIRGTAVLELDLVDGLGRSVPVRVGTSALDVGGNRLLCLTFADLRAQKAQDREIARLAQAADRVADLQRAQLALTEQATHDALTGLPNRAVLVDRIDQALSQARRSGRCTAVFFVDLDRFKQVNDTRGHAAGDRVLRRVARQLLGAVRPMDTVARIGGDEFVILAPEVVSHPHALDIAARLVAELSRPPDGVEDCEGVAASVGISLAVGGRATSEIMLNEADIAMYQAKSHGRGRTEVFDATLRLQILQRSTGQQMVQSALDDRRIIVYYQPIVDLASGCVTGFEALARIAEADGSVVVPADFITIAEDSGLLVPLGAQVLKMACDEARRWTPAGPAASPLTVAVNLSARQLQSGDLAALVRGNLEDTGIDPGALHLETTEAAIMDLGAETLHQLGCIRDLGVQIGLDDFGTGYASLTHLRRLPLTFVKIDPTFVRGLETEGEDQRIVSAVVELAANLGLRSIAEGVETVDQLDRLRGLGCDQAQGYLFAGPMPPDHVATAIGRVAW